MPPTTTQNYGEGEKIASNLVQDSIEDTAIAVVQDKLGLRDGEVLYTSGSPTDILDHAYLQQAHDGIPIINAVANISLKGGNTLTTFNSSFVKPKEISPSKPTVSIDEAIRVAESSAKAAYNNHPIELQYYPKDVNSKAKGDADSNVALVLVHVIQVQSASVWKELYVDAHSGAVVGSVNFMND